jgi:hypothetical protein
MHHGDSYLLSRNGYFRWFRFKVLCSAFEVQETKPIDIRNRANRSHKEIRRLKTHGISGSA